jgi:hypothetical protein
MRINGRRGGFQFLFGIAYVMLAIGWARQDTPPGALAWIPAWIPAAAQLHPLFPTRLAAVAWAVAGGTALVGAFLPRPKDRFSFQALTFIPVLWGLFNALSFLAGDLENGLIAAVVYLVMGGAVMIVSGMSGVNERDLRPVVLDGEELVPPATGPLEIIERAAAREDADGPA